MQDHSKAVSIMASAVDMDPSNNSLYLQLLDLHTSGPAPPDMAAAEALFAKVAGSSHLSEEVKESFLTRKQQLLEEFGGNFTESVANFDVWHYSCLKHFQTGFSFIVFEICIYFLLSPPPPPPPPLHRLLEVTEKCEKMKRMERKRLVSEADRQVMTHPPSNPNNSLVLFFLQWYC